MKATATEEMKFVSQKRCQSVLHTIILDRIAQRSAGGRSNGLAGVNSLASVLTPQPSMEVALTGVTHAQ